MMVGALLSGKFEDLPKIAFMTACNALGLPGGVLWGILARSGNLVMEIVKNPAPFLKSLIGAIKKGLGQFVAKAGTYIKKALFGWLFGQVEEGGVSPPKSLSKPDIFNFIREVLGLTYKYVRARAVTIVGEKNVERVEAVVGYIKRLFTEGPAALWAEFKDKLADLRATFFDGVQEWAISKIIQAAVTKVMTMLIPGAGFLQAILGIWQTIQFFLQKIREIATLVNSILDSVSQIAKGAIGAAANYIEKSIVESLPLVISFLAKLLGLDKLAPAIKAIIEKLRTPVNKAVDTVVGGIAKAGSSAVGKVKGAVGG